MATPVSKRVGLGAAPAVGLAVMGAAPRFGSADPPFRALAAMTPHPRLDRHFARRRVAGRL